MRYLQKYLTVGCIGIFIIIINMSFKNINEEEKTTLKGRFKSVRGVMDPLSCYCYNAGYLITADNQEIPLCFPNDDEEISCENIEVTGFYKEKTIKPESTSPCPAGTKKLFYVSSHKCK